MQTGLVYAEVDGVSGVMNRVLAKHDVTANTEATAQSTCTRAYVL